jgi:hypothetical protein
MDRIRSPEIPLTITSVLEDRADPTAYRDIRSVVDVPEPETRPVAWMGWTAGLGVAAFAFVVLIVAISRRRRWLMPGGWAVQELKGIREGLNSGDLSVSNTALNLAATWRTFFEMQFGFPATSCSTDQLLEELCERKDLKAEWINELATQLNLLDLVTFAGLEPDRNEMLESVDQAFHLLEQIVVSKDVRDLSKQSGGDA